MALTLNESPLCPQRGGDQYGKESERKGKRGGKGRYIYIYYMVSSLRMEGAGAY